MDARPAVDLEHATRGIFADGLIAAHAMESANSSQLQDMVDDLHAFSFARDKVADQLAKTEHRLEQIGDWLSRLDLGVPDPTPTAVLTEKHFRNRPLLHMAFTLSASQAYGSALYRFLILTCEPACLPELRMDLERYAAEHSQMFAWLDRNLENLVVRQLRQDRILAPHPVVLATDG